MAFLRNRSILPILLITAAASHAFAGDISYVDRSIGLQTPQMEGGRTEFEFSDVNGDGHVDIVSIGDHGSPFINTPQHGVMVWFGDGSGGNWSVFQHGDFGYGGCALGDIDGDGFMDIAYGMHHDYSASDLGDQILEVALGDGTGRFWNPWDDGLATNGETWGMFGTDLADVDHDGDLDVGSISFGCCAGLHVYLNHGDGTWTQSWGFNDGNSSMEFQFGDFNGDGFADFAASHGSGTVYVGDGAGNFTLEDGNLPFGPWRRGVSIGDVNGDGRDDLAFRTPSGVEVWTWRSPGVWGSLTGSLGAAGLTNLTQIADMNLDGFGDVIAQTDNVIRIYTGDGSGNWVLAAQVNGPAACDEAAIRAGTDADHNGYPDFLYVAEEGCDPWVGGVNRPRFFAEASVPADAFIAAKYPRGGEVWFAGSLRFIDWNAAVPAGEGNPQVSIEFSTSGPDGPWTMIADHVPNSGRVQWTVPGGMPSTEAAHLRYTLHTSSPVSAVTPASFTIEGGPAGEAADLMSFEIVTGALLQGTINDLRESDDSYVHTRSGFGGTLVDLHHMEMRIDAATDVQNPAALDLAFEMRIDEPSGTAQVRLLNHGTSMFEQVGQFGIGTSDEVREIIGVAAGSYVSGQGEIELAIKHIVFVPFLAFTFESWVDLVEIAVR